MTETADSALKGLKHGDTISVIAPAGPVTHEEIQPAIEILKQKGFKIQEGRHLYDRQGYLAGKDSDRLDDLYMAFEDSSIRAIICARGGYGTPRLLDKIDFEIIKKNPKLLIGFSDITALLLAITCKTGLPVWHGPMLRSPDGREQNLERLVYILSSKGEIDLKLEEKNVLKKGMARGKLMGGNLALLSSLIGTPYLPDFTDSILFLEDIAEPVYRIDRMITQLRLAGILKNVRGILAGYFQDCGEADVINGLLLESLEGDCPMYSGFPTGHGKENYPLPFGVEAELNTEALTLKVDPFIDLE